MTPQQIGCLCPLCCGQRPQHQLYTKLNVHRSHFIPLLCSIESQQLPEYAHSDTHRRKTCLPLDRADLASARLPLPAASLAQVLPRPLSALTGVARLPDLDLAPKLHLQAVSRPLSSWPSRPQHSSRKSISSEMLGRRLSQAEHRGVLRSTMILSTRSRLLREVTTCTRRL